MSIVVDAGAVCELLIRRGFESAVAAAIVGDDAVCAPALLDLEVLSSVRALAARRVIGPEVARDAIGALRVAPIDRVPHGALVPRVWALRDRLTAYDAAYLALAEVGDPSGGPATLVTTDGRFGRTARSVGTVPVVVIPVS